MKIPMKIGPTVTTGTSEVEVGGTGARFTMPFDGSILAMKIEAERAGVATAAESDRIVVRLTSQSKTCLISPYEAFAQPVNAGVGADIAPFKEEANWLPINCPAKSGDLIKVTCAEEATMTVHSYVTVTFKVGDMIAIPQYHSQIGTLTSTGTAAAEVPMTGNPNAIGITGAVKIVEIYGSVTDTTNASGKGIISAFRLSSNQWLNYSGDMTFGGEGVAGILAGAAGQGNARLTTMREFDIPLKPNVPCYIAVYHSLGVALTTAGNFNIQIVWT